MQEELRVVARQFLKDNLVKLPESNQLLFKRMYSHENLDLSIEDVVDGMPDERLDWAMSQVKKTLLKKTQPEKEG